MEIKKIIGKLDKIKFWIKSKEINLIVVSDNITNVNPTINVINLIFWYMEFSFELIISKNGIKDNNGI